MSSQNVVVKHILVEGLVQGVSFRYFITENANRLGMTGWVRNLSDGRVEIVAMASDNSTMGEFLKSVKTGPPHSDVRKVDVQVVSSQSLNFEEFVIRRDGGPTWP